MRRSTSTRVSASTLTLFLACGTSSAPRVPGPAAEGGDAGQSGGPTATPDAGAGSGGGGAAGDTGGKSGSSAGDTSDASGGATGESAGMSGEAGSSESDGCGFTVTATLSSKIATVGIVEWNTELRDISSASIEFGLDSSYGMSAPVDLGAPSFRTLLLGMKPSRTYHFHVVARGKTARCVSRDFTLETGATPNGLPRPTLTQHGGKAAGGFLLSSFLTEGPAFVLDADGEFVWSYGTGEMARAALSHDGKYVWYAAINVAGGSPSMKRVTLDGLEETDFSAEFGEIHHDFTILPDDTIAFLEHTGDTDRVMERAPSGELREVLDVGAALGVTHTHSNSIHHFAADDSYTLSELAENAYLKFTRKGVVSWILGGSASDFSGDGATWEGQHGHQLLAADRLLFFNNGPSNGTSAAIEVSLDLKAMTAERVWQYQPGPHCLIYGDVQRLSGGNTLVTFSTLGLIHEVDADAALVRELAWPLGGAVGYMTALPSLYPQY